jgi:Prenyltransferase and squalene oxidase repeat
MTEDGSASRISGRRGAPGARPRVVWPRPLWTVCVAFAALAPAGLASAAPAPTPVDFVSSRQQPDGGFAEPGGRSDPALTAWAVLGLKAAGRAPARSPAAYLRETPAEDTTDLALRVLALRALGESPGPVLERLQRQRRRDGRIGALVNSTIWGLLALPRGERAAVRYVLRRQRRSGGWSWAPNGAADSNDTAAAIQALRWNGVRGRPIRRGLAYIRRLTAPSGGVRLTVGREPDAQSTAWAIQAYVAAGARPPAAAFRYLASLRRSDGSYRYSRRYAVTPAIVTAQVLPALRRKPFPLR